MVVRIVQVAGIHASVAFIDRSDRSLLDTEFAVEKLHPCVHVIIREVFDMLLFGRNGGLCSTG